MADEQYGNVLSAAFPAPPPFYQYFTPENLRRLSEAKQFTEQGHDFIDTSSASQPLLRLSMLKSLDLVPELQYLIPPEPPADGTYRSFGVQYDISNSLPSLREQGVEQLYSTPPSSPGQNGDASQNYIRVYELTKIVRSILLNFLEFVGILSMNPAQYAKKWEDLKTLFLNAHHLINEYRPHQARETLITMMESQLAKKRAEVGHVVKMKDKVDNILADLKGLSFEDDARTPSAPDQEESVRPPGEEQTRRVSKALESTEPSNGSLHDDRASLL